MSGDPYTSDVRTEVLADLHEVIEALFDAAKSGSERENVLAEVLDVMERFAES